jgi:hypothetical protein
VSAVAVAGSGGLRYCGAMNQLRSVLFGLLVVALLPWGAWISDRGALPRAQAVVEQVGATLQPRAAHRCRTALLPGQSCGMDVALLPPLTEMRLPGGAKLLPPALILSRAAVMADPATPPPKSA